MRCGAASPRPQRRLDKIGACKAERFIGTLVREWAYARTYATNAARLAALPAFVEFYNHRRPHTALGGLSPAAVVNNVHADHT
jgi:transposase InsO family protein